MAKRTRPTFQIPNAEAMAKFEKEPPKPFQSHFKTRNQLSSSGNDRPQDVTRSLRGGLSKIKKTTSTTDSPSQNHSIQQRSAVGTKTVNSSISLKIGQQSKENESCQPTDVVEPAKRKAGSSFAAKFGSLQEVEDVDYQTNIPSKNTESTKVAKPSVDGKPSTTTAVTNSKSSTNCILVNPRQRGNPILKSVRNVPWEFGDIVPDYVMGRTMCALFLSLRYHHLNPNYIHRRLKELGHSYELRILLVQVDVKDPHFSLKELARMAILAECTLILAWSPEEAGRYLETYKSYENKPVDALKERVEQDFVAQVTDCLTTVKSVNKTDVVTLLSTFGSVEKIASAEKEELCLLPGFGPQKAQRLHDVFQEPFLKQS